MKIEIITIGDELLIGQVVDTNSAWMGRALNDAGFEVSRINSISDSEAEILSTLKECEHRADVVLLTGGLGPTKDDITKTTLCKYFDDELVHDEDVYQDIETFLKGRVTHLNAFNKQQALVPSSCDVIRNHVGTAPIMWFEHEGVVFVSMPGVPSEMKQAMNSDVIPRMQARFGAAVILHKTLLVYGIPEAVLAEKLDVWERELPGSISLAYLPAFGSIRLRMTARGSDKSLLSEELKKQVVAIKSIIGDSILAYDDKTVTDVISFLLKEKGLSLATAESCTGGNIAHQITSLPGSSEFFLGGVVAYSNEVKKTILGVEKEALEKYGAVSELVVRQMANGVRNNLGADFGVATSGVAGPGGGSEEKPVGTVWIAVAGAEKTVSKCFHLGNIRDRTIERASDIALVMLKELI